ncbi:MAG: TetR family transcriptional regulator [Gemmatirosa sp.]|nr:TetR family transcriptional regulator [Gemmatirosa sp.]
MPRTAAHPEDEVLDRPPAAGRRAGQLRATRERLMRAAQTLFAERGFDATTVDEIAAAAGVSRRTFFHHFASKEDVILSRHADFEAALLAAVAAQPPDEPPLRVAERAIVAALGTFDREEAVLIQRLKRDTPSLRASDQGKYERMERALTDHLQARAPDPSDALRVRLVAMIIVGAMRVAGDGWLRAAESGEAPETYARRVFQTLHADLGAPPAR